MIPRHATRGFTLLEVMVALAVLAIALAALIKGVAGNGANAAALRDRTFAHWVGMNVVAEQRLLGEWPPKEGRRGEAEMGNHTWFWRALLIETEDEDVGRLEVEVFADEGREGASLARLVAFLPRASKGGT